MACGGLSTLREMGSAAHPVRLEQRHDVSGPRSRSDGLPAATRPRSHPAGCRIGLQHWPVSVIAPALRNPLTSPRTRLSFTRKWQPSRSLPIDRAPPPALQARDRQPDCCLHTVAITQIRHPGHGRVDDQRNVPAGKVTGSPALSEEAALRLGLSPADPRQHPSSHSGSGRTRGGVYEIQRGRLNPYHRLFGSVTSRTHRRRPYNDSQTHQLTHRGAV
jgi:hypothetical protein